jgi:hypothetical protein
MLHQRSALKTGGKKPDTKGQHLYEISITGKSTEIERGFMGPRKEKNGK